MLLGAVHCPGPPGPGARIGDGSTLPSTGLGGCLIRGRFYSLPRNPRREGAPGPPSRGTGVSKLVRGATPGPGLELGEEGGGGSPRSPALSEILTAALSSPPLFAGGGDSLLTALNDPPLAFPVAMCLLPVAIGHDEAESVTAGRPGPPSSFHSGPRVIHSSNTSSGAHSVSNIPPGLDNAAVIPVFRGPGCCFKG